jgi:hypothetical protein
MGYDDRCEWEAEGYSPTLKLGATCRAPLISAGSAAALGWVAPMLDRLKAMMLLSECSGRDIWPVELCREKGVPESWIEELADCYESGYQSPLQTIYVGERPTNQFYGVHDLHLAYKLGEFLGVATEQVTAGALGRIAEVRAIQQAVEEG